jgi:3-deoxy-D-manno-octulosonic-acid transferase
VSAALAVYRAMTGAVGLAVAPIGAAVAPSGSAWRERWGRIPEIERVAGGPWIHAASLGEALAARRWVEALLDAGYRPPILVTARTGSGKDRLARELGDRALAAIAPMDFPISIRRVLRAAAPWRLDLIETELWPNLLVEARRAEVPVVAVSATVSERSASRLRRWGLAGEELFGRLFVLAQSEPHADRFRALGVADERIRVIGDLKAEHPSVPDADVAAGAPPRDLVVFASLRPGEEGVAATVARALRLRPDARRWRYVVAPRHDHGVRSAARDLEAAGFTLARRAEGSPDSSAVRAWAAGLAPVGEAQVGLLETRGELASLFVRARVALVGGSFAPFGGHNVLEQAAAGASVVVGPYHGDVGAAVAALQKHGACDVAADGAAAARAVGARLDAPGSGASVGAIAAVGEAAGAARRGLDALASWGLAP